MSENSWDILEKAMHRGGGILVVTDSRGQRYFTAPGRPRLNSTKQARKRARKRLEDMHRKAGMEIQRKNNEGN